MGKIEERTRSIEGNDMVADCGVCDAFTYRFHLCNMLVRNMGIIEYIKGTDYSSAFVTKDDGKEAL
jgi:hypothetical protein